MKRIPITAAICLALLVALGARAADLGIGDAAPKLAQGKYVQGEPVKEFEKGKVYVIEMWATWCGPCISAIPHVTELQKKYEDKGLIVIGQNVWERDESKVEPFVKQMAEKMTYRVAMDDKSGGEPGAMAKTWMQAAGQNGIPCSFIVNQEGKIAWIGHPMQMDEPLAKVIEGKFDVAEAKAEHARKQAAAKSMQELGRLAQTGKWDQVVARLDEIEKSDPKQVKELAAIRFQALTETKQPEKAKAIADEALKNVKSEPLPALMIGNVAMRAKDYDTALKLFEAAAEHAKGNAYFAYMSQANIHAARQDWAKAVEAQKKAIETAPNDRAKEQFTQQLKHYEEKAAAQ
jgi:thiol-disulfide isomerase/thioredoxin